MEREPKGIWIPIEIWEDNNLSWHEKILFAEIDSFTSKNKDCYISNEYIAKLLKITETTANKVLSSLIKKGYVIKTKFDGRHRFIKTALTYTINQGCSAEQGWVAQQNNILYNNTNIIDNKEDKDKSLSKKETIDYQKIVDAWNNMTNNIDTLSKVLRLTDSRKKSIATLLKKTKSNVDELIRFIKTIPYADEWVVGKSKDRDWHIEFDWLMKNTSEWYTRGLEGEMHKINKNLFKKMMSEDYEEPTNVNINGIEYQ